MCDAIASFPANVHKEIPRFDTCPLRECEHRTYEQAVLIQPTGLAKVCLAKPHKHFVPDHHAHSGRGVREELPVEPDKFTKAQPDVIAAFNKALLKACTRLQRRGLKSMRKDQLLPQSMLVTWIGVGVGEDRHPRVTCPERHALGQANAGTRSGDVHGSRISSAHVRIHPQRKRGQLAIEIRRRENRIPKLKLTAVLSPPIRCADRTDEYCDNDNDRRACRAANCHANRSSTEVTTMRVRRRAKRLDYFFATLRFSPSGFTHQPELQRFASRSRAPRG